MQVAHNDRFASWFFSGTSVGRDVSDDVEIATNVYVCRRLDLSPGLWRDRWREWLGSVAMDKLEKSGLILYATAVGAAEHTLRQRCEDVLNGLLLQGVPYHQRRLTFLVGANVDGERLGVSGHRTR